MRVLGPIARWKSQGLGAVAPTASRRYKAARRRNWTAEDTASFSIVKKLISASGRDEKIKVLWRC